jgi:hypothetical protein
LAIEKCLVQKLPSLFTQDMVHGMTDEEVSEIAAESLETTAMRDSCTVKRRVFESAIDDFKRLDKSHFSVGKSRFSVRVITRFYLLMPHNRRQDGRD